MNPQDVNTHRGTGIPGAHNVDHFAITVPDLEQAVNFFVVHLGASLLYVEGPIARGTWMTTNLAVPAEASCRVAMLRFGPITNLELFQYETPGACLEPPRNCDVGGSHIAIFVDDIDRAHEYVRGLPGVICQGEPKTIIDGPLKGDRWMYFTTPWGLQMELIALPANLPYEHATPERRFGPYEGPWEHAHANEASGEA